MIREALKATGTARRVALAILFASLLISGCGSGAESITAGAGAPQSDQTAPSSPPTTTLWGQRASGTTLTGNDLLGRPEEMVLVGS